MHARMKLINHEKMLASMTLTMSLEEWRELQKTIGDKYPGWKFSHLIDTLIGRANQHFDEESEITK